MIFTKKSLAAWEATHGPRFEGEEIAGRPLEVAKMTRQEKWRTKNKAKVAKYMKEWRAKQKSKK